MEYGIYKLIHLVAVVLFLGNTTTGIFWIAHAARRKDPALLAHAMDGVIRSDRLFTIPGVIVIVAGGLAAAIAGGLPLLRTGWIAASLVLFTVSGAAFMWLAPLQRQIRDYAAGASPEWAQCTSLLDRWKLVGLVSLAPVWVAMALMVLKIPR